MTAPTHSDHTLTLPDGRTLGYVRFGPADGYPVFYCHGNFGSRLDPLMVRPETLERTHVNLISPDRPGIGLSTFQKRRRVLDWPADVLALADALGLEQFALMSLSAGCPYAAACALKIPERLTAVTIVSGVAPPEAKAARAGMNASGTYFRLARRSPYLVSLLLALTKYGLRDPDTFIVRAAADMPEPDRRMLVENAWVRPAFLTTMENSLSSGLRGLAYDAMLVARSWGFSLQDISMPVRLWHGEADHNAPPAMGRYMAGAIPQSSLRLIPEEGHFSLALNYFEEILEELAPRA